MHKRTTRVEIDEQGHLILSPEVMKRYGLTPGASIQIRESENQLSLSRSTESLHKVYVEPTNLCNLGCRTCMRNVWDEPLGMMHANTFSAILEGVRSCSPPPSVFFGGFGEPLAHPAILDMIAAVRQVGAEVDMITNGTLLTETVGKRLVELGLNRLWVSLDGATPESYTDVRLGAVLPEVIANLRHLKALRGPWNDGGPRLGIAFVAMKRNIADLPEVVRLGKSLGADRFSISNVLPHTAEQREEMLYARSFFEGDPRASEWAPLIELPRMEINALTGEPILRTLKNRHVLSVARQEIGTGESMCPFVEKGSVSIRWDGAVSPCLALLHTHDSYLDDHIRKSQAFAVGSLLKNSLTEIWNDPNYMDLRERLMKFDFSPCVYCNSCEMAEANLEDCFGNTQPACGGCLWAQGFIQCP